MSKKFNLRKEEQIKLENSTRRKTRKLRAKISKTEK